MKIIKVTGCYYETDGTKCTTWLYKCDLSEEDITGHATQTLDIPDNCPLEDA